ncbi:MAG: hypothetical protein AAGE76_04040 [Pseudomonadota bacterium]
MTVFTTMGFVFFVGMGAAVPAEDSKPTGPDYRFSPIFGSAQPAAAPQVAGPGARPRPAMGTMPPARLESPVTEDAFSF